MKNKSVFLSFIIVLLAAIAFVATSSQAATRDLVFEDDEEEVATAAQAAKEAGISEPEVISVKTTFDLTNASGETISVPSDNEFKSGDKIKLRYTTNTDGYAYWLAKMSSGKYTILFPSKESGSNNFVKKNENQTVPVKGYFRFDDTPGTEELLLIFGTDKIPELEQAVLEASNNNGVVSENVTQVASVESKEESTTRDLVFEDEDEDEEVDTKTQVGASGEPFVQLYSLTHK
jgi:type II secretory pathway pseudopilin PulG